ncbi:MAG: U32 family peptidase [Deferribacteraceae bacterium]|jgi:putative protease|nr:U32 family peptidase [Deferribacteraceae bacterium]
MELLSPAGNMAKLEAAVAYGADAVYFSGAEYGLRAYAGNFTEEEIGSAMKYLHNRGKKGYLAVNAYARDHEIPGLKDYLKKMAALEVDAFIISDPGVFWLAADTAPNIDRFISTQANTTNSSAVRFWAEQGAKRVILARELSKEELAAMSHKPSCELEVFAHGALCISYSGRCLISAYMSGRDANRGECAQPCRWKYKSAAIREETRRNQDMEIAEDKAGTYLYNAKDLCLINRVGELAKIGITSLKIEGRMKSVMYVAVVTGVYRRAIDLALKNPEEYSADPYWRTLLESVSNRSYTEGFYAGVPDRDAMNYDSSAYIRNSDFLGVARGNNGNCLEVECTGKFITGETLSLLTPELKEYDLTVKEIRNSKGVSLEFSRSNEIMTIPSDIRAPKLSILRRILIPTCN